MTTLHQWKPATLSLCIACATSTVYAMDYGIYDARGLAMSGTAVSIGNTAQAAYYNPALLAFHKGDEDTSRDGRTYFPTLVAQGSETINSAYDAVNDELDTKLSNSIDQFNALYNSTNAAQVASAASDLRKVLNKISNKDITADAFVGLSVSEPSDFEGGAFYLGARVIGAGSSSVTKTDLALLDEYIAATNEAAAGATKAQLALAHPALVNTDGTLKDPTQTLSSSADVGALAIGEWGVAMGKEFHFWGQSIALGITPKMMRVDAYRDQANFQNSNLSSVDQTVNQFSDTKSTHITFNADLGIAATFYEHYRVSLAVKDIDKKEFKTHQDADPVTGQTPPDLVVKLSPRSRLGLGYLNGPLSIGLDYDLQESKPIANESPSQFMSLGGEYVLWDSLAFRVGYKHDKTGLHSNSTSAGLGYRWRRFVIDLGYASGGDMKGGGLQMGWTF